MEITILNSPLFREKNSNYDEDSLPPLGLGIIATGLKNEGHDVELIDAVAEQIPVTDLIQLLNKKQPNFIGLNVFTTNLELVKDIVEGVSCKTHFIIGALSTQSLHQEIFRWQTPNHIDVVHGDGELIAKAIVVNHIQEQPVVENHNRRFFKVGTSSTYFVKDISNDVLDRSFFVNEPIIHPFGFTEANIVTSRGCVYNCAFCAAARSLNKDFAIREKSRESIVAEIASILEAHPNLQSIRVLDDLFLKNSASVAKAIDVFNHFNLQWRSMAHVQTFRNVEENTIRELRRSGCKELFIGIESGSPRILKGIHKTTDVEIVKNNLSMLLRNGISIKGYFIFGFPGEKKEDFELTYTLAKDLNEIALESGSRFRTSVFQFRPYHGTELYHSLELESGDAAFAKVSAVEPDKELSDLVGRVQFNFHSGNYSDEPVELVREYINKTTILSSTRIRPIHGKNTDYFQKNKAV